MLSFTIALLSAFLVALQESSRSEVMARSLDRKECESCMASLERSWPIDPGAADAMEDWLVTARRRRRGRLWTRGPDGGAGRRPRYCLRCRQIERQRTFGFW